MEDRKQHWSSITLAIARVVAVVPAVLVLRAADEVSAEGAETGAYGSAFESAAALTADDTADACATESTDDGARACAGAVGARGHQRG